MLETIEREIIYISYYFMVQFRQIFIYWVLGMVIGSLISVFAKDAIHSLFAGLKDKKMGIWGVVPASLLGTLSPLCMYGTIPIAASFSRQGMRDDWLAAFMMSSILLNPQLMLYSTALGGTALAVRIISCILCGITAGILVRIFFRQNAFFHFDGFAPGASRDTDPNPFLRFLKNLGRNVRATGLYFLIGDLLYGHRTGDKDHQPGCAQDRAGDPAFPPVPGVCDGVLASDRDGGQSGGLGEPAGNRRKGYPRYLR